MRRVVITGMGALTPIGNSVASFANGLLNGLSGAGNITRFDTSNFKVSFACELKNYRPLDYFDTKELRKFDLFSQYALVSVEEAVKQADLDFEKLDRDRVGVIWGSGNGGVQSFYDQVMEYAQGGGIPRFTPYFIPRILVDIASGIISIKYGLRGVNFCPVSACATSNTALIEAFNYIRWNKADVIISGGSEAPINPSVIGGFSSARALSTRNESPETASRPFDPTRDGFVIGEGAGALVLEELSHAKRRGAIILAEIVGGGMAAEAYHLTGTHPEGTGAVLGMNLALNEAKITPNQVSCINMHATSTPLGDISELNAVASLFNGVNDLSLSATKSMTGHLLGAAGAIEAIASVISIQEQCALPTINTTSIDGAFEFFDFPLSKPQKKEINYVMSNTFGFGGHIASILLKKWDKTIEA
ncbi:MAG: beta-ketoacyl-ACP synthase II [Bacteroidetes bacterium]|nr:beta-ketoacyl-ACP synthase II [Bacteroidota bacterium]